MNKFILRSYLGPFLRSLGVSLFILVLQFLSRYKNDLFGKGLDAWVLVKIFAFASTSLLVLAFPVSVLLASLFTMGNFGENYELAAMRSGGLSIQRILRPMLAATIFIAILSFGMSSYIVPLANLKLYSLLYDIQQMKPTFTLQPGHFNSSVDNYVILIEDKDIDREVLYNIMIYDHTSQRGNDRLVRADSGIMKVDPYGRYMHMALYHGVSYEARPPDYSGKGEGFVRFYFDTLLYAFDLAGFSLERTEEQAFSTHQYMLNLTQLRHAMDSIETVKENLVELYGSTIAEKTRIDSNFVNMKPREIGDPPPDILQRFPKGNQVRILEKAIANVTSAHEITQKALEVIESENLAQRERMIEYHGKFSLPIACLVFLFVGAPLGAIIRKGGVGIPIVVSVSLYLAFYVLMIQGKKMATEGVLPPWAGAWMPNMILMPLAVYLTFESATTGGLLSADFLRKIGNVLLRVFLLYLNPLYWLWLIPPVQRAVIFVLRPVVRRFFPERAQQRREFRVRR